MSDKIGMIHKEEIKETLYKMGILSTIENGEAICYCCNKTITLQNFKAITKFEGKLYFACENDLCVLTLCSLDNSINEDINGK